MKTTGDRIQNVSLAKIGGKGLFVKEIEEALLDGRADVAVHSAKDLPAQVPAGLEFVAFPERADPRDALVGRERGASLAGLPHGARVGTGSVRRIALLVGAAARPRDRAAARQRPDAPAQARRREPRRGDPRLRRARSPGPRSTASTNASPPRSCCPPSARASWPSRAARATRSPATSPR